MGVVINPESEYGKEVARWNKPYRYEPFPKMVFRAIRRDDGIIVTSGETEAVNRQCQFIVNSEQELTKSYEAGWRESPAAAIEFFKKINIRDAGTAAAHRNYEDRNMSEQAKAEAREYENDGDTVEHIPVIPEAPKKRRRRRSREE